MARVDVVVVGGGIGGLAVAWHLASRGAGVCLVEREPLLAAHASGRNAAIFRQLDSDLAGARLAARSRELLAGLAGRGEVLLARTGAIYAGASAALEPLVELGRRAGVEVQRLEPDGLARRVPALAGGDAPGGLWVPDDGVLDVHAVTQALARELRARRAVVRTGVAVGELVVRRGRVEEVRLSDGASLSAGHVVVAAGAWTSGLADGLGLPLPIEPRRRHLALLVPPAPRSGPPERPVAPVVWRVDEQVYFRPESGGVLASPCDEEPWPAGVPPAAPEALSELAARLGRLAPGLAELSVRTSWACLRSFAPDGGFVAGPDPRVGGLSWIAGLGGRGMTCGLALGEVVAAAVLGEPHPLAAELSPARLVGADAVRATS